MNAKWHPVFRQPGAIGMHDVQGILLSYTLSNPK